MSFHLGVSRFGASLLCDEGELLLKGHVHSHDPFDRQFFILPKGTSNGTSNGT
jgi:hypothetical protein